jgi:hypothetical protein
MKTKPLSLPNPVNAPVPKEELWHTSDGRVIPISELDPDHAKNALRMMIRVNRRRERAINALAIALQPALKALEARDATRKAIEEEDLLNEIMGEDKKWGSD